MTNCNFCEVKDDLNNPFKHPFMCDKCAECKESYDYEGEADDITYIDASGKRILINKDTEIDNVMIKPSRIFKKRTGRKKFAYTNSNY